MTMKKRWTHSILGATLLLLLGCGSRADDPNTGSAGQAGTAGQAGQGGTGGSGSGGAGGAAGGGAAGAASNYCDKTGWQCDIVEATGCGQSLCVLSVQGPQCYPPTAQKKAVGVSCQPAVDFCVAGAECVDFGAAGGAKCTRLCCTSADCAATGGVCNPFPASAPAKLGACILLVAAAGRSSPPVESGAGEQHPSVQPLSPRYLGPALSRSGGARRDCRALGFSCTSLPRADRSAACTCSGIPPWPLVAGTARDATKPASHPRDFLSRRFLLLEGADSDPYDDGSTTLVYRHAMAKPEISKKDAILAIGLDKTTAEIISLAANQGVRVSRTYVDLLKQQNGARQTRKARPSGAGKKQAKRRALKTSPNAHPETGGESKAAYVRSFPAGTKAAEIVAQGKEAGIALTTKYVYRIRGSAGTSRGSKRRTSPAAAAPRVREPRPSKPSDTESAFTSAVVALVIDGGVPAARARFEDIIAKVLGAASSA